MILSEIKRYLMQHKQVTLGDLSIHFDTDPEAMRGMLDQWVRKGSVLKSEVGTLTELAQSLNSIDHRSITTYKRDGAITSANLIMNCARGGVCYIEKLGKGRGE